MESPAEDGRRARSARGKQSAIEAIVATLSANEPIQGMAHLAEIAGISERSLFRYFGSQDGMFLAVAEHLAPATLPFLIATPPKGSLEARVRELAKLRCEFALKFSAMGRTVDRFVNQFDSATQLRANRDALVKKQLKQWLSPEYRSLDKRTAAVVAEMFNFEFVDAMNSQFGNRAPTVIADHVLLLMRTKKS